MKHTETTIAHYRKQYGKEEYCLNMNDMTGWQMGWTKIGPVTVEYETPDDFNPISAQVQRLVDDKNALIASFKEKLEVIEEELGKLQALDFVP